MLDVQTLTRLKPHHDQELAISQIVREKHTLLKAGVGAGKTLCAVEAILRAETEVNLIVAPLATFTGWNKTFLRQGGTPARFIDTRKAGVEAHRDLANEVPGNYFMSTERMRTQDWRTWKLDFVVIDECFVAGTQIETPQGPRNIEDLRVGDSVYGYDHTTQSVVITTVRDTMVRTNKDVMPNGATVNHPYWVDGVGYLPLGDITSEDNLFAYQETKLGQDTPTVRTVRGDVLLKGEDHTELQQVMCHADACGTARDYRREVGGCQGLLEQTRESEGAVREGHSADARSQLEIAAGCVGTHDAKQSRLQSSSDSQGASNQEGKGDNLRAPDRRQWDGTYQSRSDALGGAGLEYTARCADGRAEGERVPLSLQAGHSQPRVEDRGGVRRAEPPLNCAEGAGCEEGGTPGIVGVDNLEILEPRDRERIERVRSASKGDSQTVYNIETGTSNYFAGGFLVHNCHRLSNRKSTNFKRALTMKPTYALSLSATPFGGKVEGAWAIGRWLWRAKEIVDTSFHRWATEYLHTEFSPHTKYAYGGEQDAGRILREWPSVVQMKSVYTKRPVIHEVEVVLNPTQRRHYKEMEEDAITWLDENPLVAELPSVRYIRLLELTLATPSIKQDWIRKKNPDTDEWERVWGDVVYFEPDAKSSKADAVKEILDDLHIETPEPVIIYTHSRKFATFLAMRLQKQGFRARQWVGGMSQEEQTWKLENFGKEFDVLVATLPAIGEGTDGIQHVCANEIWCSVSDRLILNEQARGRTNRQGQKRTVNRWVVRAQETVELKQHDRIKVDQSVLDASYGEESTA